MGEIDETRYGVVIDAGSSGSRIHIFKWENPNSLLSSTQDQELLQSVPHIIQDKDWTHKVTPGLSKFNKKPHKAFSDHVKPLLEFASEIIPKEKLGNTPVFIQATAGMRLLPEKERNKILSNLCAGIGQSSGFLLQNCESQIQVIDGELEGLYGWVGLNYLFGHFNSYDVTREEHFTFGFMDMGGASTQIAFAPSDPPEVSKHKDDISTVYLKSVNGDIQEWSVFVSTWLGFGANEARRRYLVQLINSLPENANDSDDDDFTTRKISDPCVPKNCKTKFRHLDTEFEIWGTGNYEQCSKSIYPLLLKNLPCSEEPCLFNGVHAPQIDYYKDKFIGTSEYWYTANDIFNLGGTYNFEEFSTHVEEFCNTDWEVMKDNSEKGAYNSIPTNFLIDSCFKANWVLNILHEGFDLPRAGIDSIETEKVESNHPLFQSAESVKDRELSWTLGRILLYACGDVQAGRTDIIVGVKPSENSLLIDKFVAGLPSSNINDLNSKAAFFELLAVAVLITLLLRFIVWPSRQGLRKILNSIKIKSRRFKYFKIRPDPQAQLEEGTFENNMNESFNGDDREGCKYRSKSMFNLNSEATQDILKYPIHLMNMASSNGPSVPMVPSAPSPQMGKILRPAFSLADFSKFKDDKFND